MAHTESDLARQSLIPDPTARPWPKPAEYVLVSWGVTLVFGPLIAFFWLVGDVKTLPVSLGVAAYLTGHVVLIYAMTSLTARETGFSRREVTSAVLRSLPKRILF